MSCYKISISTISKAIYRDNMPVDLSHNIGHTLRLKRQFAKYHHFHLDLGDAHQFRFQVVEHNEGNYISILSLRTRQYKSRKSKSNKGENSHSSCYLYSFWMQKYNHSSNHKIKMQLWKRVDSTSKCNYDCKVKKKTSSSVLNPNFFPGYFICFYFNFL